MKHFLLALSLHRLTGQRKLIEITNKLGHCISYSLTCETETAQVRAAQLKAQTTTISPLKPNGVNDVVVTVFWADNFDCIVETQAVGRAFNSTHLVDFQEKLYNIVLPTLPMSSNVPTSSDWETDNRTKSMEFRDVKKTVETYLPPIVSRVTDLKTIYKYLKYIQGLSADANIPFIDITLNAGAAINAYKVILNYPGHFANVLLHFGDFHFMKENFKVGKLSIFGFQSDNSRLVQAFVHSF